MHPLDPPGLLHGDWRRLCVWGGNDIALCGHATTHLGLAEFEEHPALKRGVIVPRRRGVAFEDAEVGPASACL